MRHYHEAGKGSNPRPTDYKKFSDNYDVIFGKKCQNKCKGDKDTETCLGCGRSFEEIKDAGNKQKHS